MSNNARRNKRQETDTERLGSVRSQINRFRRGKRGSIVTSSQAFKRLPQEGKDRALADMITVGTKGIRARGRHGPDEMKYLIGLCEKIRDPVTKGRMRRQIADASFPKVDEVENVRWDRSFVDLMEELRALPREQVEIPKIRIIATEIQTAVNMNDPLSPAARNIIEHEIAWIDDIKKREFPLGELKKYDEIMAARNSQKAKRS